MTKGMLGILQRADNAETGYGVDEWYNLYTVTDNGEYIAGLKQKQVNSNTDIQQNVFFKVRCFMFTVLIIFGWLSPKTMEGHGNIPEI